MNTTDFHAMRLIVNYPIQHITSWLEQHLVGSQATIVVQNRQQWASDFFLYHYQDPKKNISRYLKSCEEQLELLCRIAQKRGYHLKMLPFPVTGVFMSNLQEIISAPVFDPNHQAVQISVHKEDIAWHYMSEYLTNLEKLSEPIVVDANGLPVLPELLGVCSQTGELATSLPRKWIERENKHDNTVRKNLAHRHIYCLVVSDCGRILLHRRVGGKDNELLWDKSNGGHVSFGEPTVETCLRELEEELSICFDNSRHNLQVLDTRRNPEDHLRFVPDKANAIYEYAMFDLFLLSGVNEDDVKMNKGEVLDIQWFELGDAVAFITQHPDEVTPDLIKLLPFVEQLHRLRAR